MRVGRALLLRDTYRISYPIASSNLHEAEDTFGREHLQEQDQEHDHPSYISKLFRVPKVEELIKRTLVLATSL